MKQSTSKNGLAAASTCAILLVSMSVWASLDMVTPNTYDWDIDDQGTDTPPSYTGSGSGVIINGTGDSYDLFGALCFLASGTSFTTAATASDIYNGVSAPTMELSGRQAVLGTETIMGLEVQRRIYVTDSTTTDANGFVRYFDSIRNPTGSPITVQIRFGTCITGIHTNDLGSDSSTTVESTSDGDTLLEVGDLWFTTDDMPTSGDPSLGYVIQGPGASETVDFASLDPYGDGDASDLMWGFDSVTIPASTTVAFLTFMMQEASQTAVQAEAGYVGATPLPSEATAGLTGTQLSQVRNFTFCSDCDGDGYTIDAGDCDDYDDEVHPGVTTDMCDGRDNDCDTSTPDGSSESWYGTPCDGPDTDLCPDGIEVCISAARGCNDDDTLSPDICDGEDNDCDSTTADGSGDPLDGTPCDGDDTDLCPDGTYSCVAGALECSDTMDVTPELCDGIDNDCEPSTEDGVGEDWFGQPCDGPDPDLCEEGVYECIVGTQSCNDRTEGIDELCDGVDNDCDPSSEDGADETWLGDPCDGPDLDLCSEGVYSCVGGEQSCNDHSGDNVELCNGVDDDCNPGTLETMDNDGDGISSCGGDCNDGDPTIHPGAEEICDDIDQDCDPATDHDGDGDGYKDCEGDCQPRNPAIHPGAEEVCNDGQDNDCDGLVDGIDPDCGGTYFGESSGCSCSTAAGAGRGGLAWMGLVLLVLGVVLARSRRTLP